MSMQPFLQIVATQLLERFKGQLHELAVVFPNRRQAVFFSSYLQQLAAPPCFLPELLTIEELVAKSGSMQVADNLTQGFALYEAYVQIAKEKGDTDIPPFDVFFSIGETILKDFREIDSYLVNVEDICQILYDIESIDKRFDQLTEEQRAFLKSFGRAPLTKEIFRKNFSACGSGCLLSTMYFSNCFPIVTTLPWVGCTVSWLQMPTRCNNCQHIGRMWHLWGSMRSTKPRKLSSKHGTMQAMPAAGLMPIPGMCSRHIRKQVIFCAAILK
ncbi:hypothetical protein [Phnomibacter ginsenosidimutans]|uniref:hypothetical protein n=1 Tax=Phnomibacter ginsenosidimutans TaxID=2676868 RepID=UPI001FE6BF1C|nr:hypothetical protein [Phnomibacter ginsenosidimutans]